MINSSKWLLVALITPILALFILAGVKSFNLNAGVEVTLPISGYDPRDLLSGHYLIYVIDYGVENVCSGTVNRTNVPAYICLAPNQFSYSRPENCELMIKGECKSNRFKAGIEKFFIPQEKASHLDKLVRGGKASIVLSVRNDGGVQIKNMLIDDRPWTEEQIKE